MKKAWVLGAAVWAAAGAAWAGALPEIPLQLPEKPGGVAVAGRQMDAGLYCVQMAITQFEDVQTHPEWAITGVEIYAEPSHTLLAVYTEPMEPPFPAARVHGSGPIGVALPLLCTREALPDGDDRVALTVLTESGPRALGVISTSLLDFNVSVVLPPDPDMPPLEFCCICGNCRQCEFGAVHCVCYCPDCHIVCKE